MAHSRFVLQARHRTLAAVAGAFAIVALSACDLPLGLGLPSTRSLESGAAGSLTTASSFEITGSYTESGSRWSIDLQLTRPNAEHVLVSTPNEKLEAIILGNDAYFRGQAFLSQHLGSDLISRNFVKAAGNSWWKSSADQLPKLLDLTDGSAFRSTFLGSAVTQRSDHVSVSGVDAVGLSGPRAEVFITAAPPYRVLRVHMKPGVVIDGIGEGDLQFGNFNQAFRISAPPDVIDFSNLSSLPPIYTVLSVDTSGCASPCRVSALLKNLGGMSGAQAASTITFTLTDSASGQKVGSCQVQVIPDVGYNATTSVGCTIDNLVGPLGNAATVTATPDNPGRA